LNSVLEQRRNLRQRLHEIRQLLTRLLQQRARVPALALPLTQ
jgi:hypothetical protein